MTIEIAHVQSPGDQKVAEMQTATEGIELGIESHFEALGSINAAVRNDDMTEKKAEEARQGLSDKFLAQTFAALDAVERKHAELFEYCAKLANPPDPLEAALERSNELIDTNVKLALQKSTPDAKGIFTAATPENAVLLSNWLLLQQGQQRYSMERQKWVLDEALSTKGGILTERDGAGFKGGPPLNEYQMRLHLYKQALLDGDIDAITVYENRAYESKFFFDGKDKARTVWVAFMKLKGEALASRKDPELERDKTAAQGLMDEGNRTKYLVANRISDMLTNGKLTLANDDQFERISRLLSDKVRIGGKPFGHSSFNPFAVRKAMKAKAGGN